jgi:predicted flap endonuclease-1-like 5' DNA nuclease
MFTRSGGNHMSGLSIYWFLIVPLLSEPTGEAPAVPLWLWIFLGLIIVGLPILTIVFGPGLRRKAIAEVVVPLPEHAPEGSPEADATPAPKGPLPAERDDLTRIEGIGPQIARTLQEAGITTFDALGTTSADRLSAILAQKPNLRLADPTSWPQQAILAAVGDWDELERLQAELKGGRGTM